MKINLIQASISVLIPLFVNSLYKLIYISDDEQKESSLEFLERRREETNKYHFISFLGTSSLIGSFFFNNNNIELNIGGCLTLLFANINYWNFLTRLSKTLILGSSITALIVIENRI